VEAETETVRRIVATLESMPPEHARFLAGFAYILGRAAEADMDISATETSAMERLVVEYGGLTEAQAIIVVEIAKTQARLHGGTEDFLVTREFTRTATEEERLNLMRCCFVVGVADDSISAAESSVLSEIANELNLDDRQIATIRAEFTDRFAAVQAMRASLGG
jgi:uncharacterized tellurite resistance protein B-like protein